MEDTSQSIRQTALTKLAAIAVISEPGSPACPDLDRLCRAVSPKGPKPSTSGSATNGFPKVSEMPMGLKEFEILLALCRASSSVDDLPNAEMLLQRLSPYLLEASAQVFARSPSLRTIEPSPWEVLSFSLSSAVLAIGHRHASLRQSALACVTSFLEHLLDSACALTTGHSGNEHDHTSGEVDFGRYLETAMITVSFLGFLKAATAYPDIWPAVEKLQFVERIRLILSETFQVAIETALSSIRNSHAADPRIKDWRRYIRYYAANGRPLGAMLLQCTFMQLMLSVATNLVTKKCCGSEQDVMSILALETRSLKTRPSDPEEAESSIINTLSDIATLEMSLLEDGADFVMLSSAWQQRLAFAVKASALTVFLICNLFNENVATSEVIMSWLDDAMNDPIQMADERLATVVLRCMAILAKLAPGYASVLSRSLPRYIVRGIPNGSTVAVAAKTLSSVLQLLSEDAVISALYTLGTVLSSGSGSEKLGLNGISPDGSLNVHHHEDHKARGSTISLSLGGEEDISTVYSNVMQAIVGIASTCQDDKITALAQSMLIQKYGKLNNIIDAGIISETARLALLGGSLQFKSLLMQYSKICHNSVVQGNHVILGAILKARNYLSRHLKRGSPLHEIYLIHLLETIVSKGDVHDDKGAERADFELAADEIAQLLPPLALLLFSSNLTRELSLSDEVLSLSRDAWFNLVVHNFSASSWRGERYLRELRQLAFHLRPLISEPGADRLESDVEFNTVLRRGMTSHNTVEQKTILAGMLPGCEADIRGLSYPKVIFLKAAHFMETLRAEMGDCATALAYFVNSNLSHGAMGSCMAAICDITTRIFLEKLMLGSQPNFAAPNMGKQLSEIFMACCHRVEEVQQMALIAANRIIIAAPSALCQRTPLFALLELLTLMWRSCLESETEEYQWKSSYASSKANFSIELSDDYALRKRTLNALYKHARGWVTHVMNIAPLDIKGLLQTYLSEYNEEAGFGHVALGRSFAIEMGSAVPSTDQQLSAISCQGDFNLDTASDFIAQYTLRQECRQVRALCYQESEADKSISPGGESCTAQSRHATVVKAMLEHLETRILEHRPVSDTELRDALRRAAAFLCRIAMDQHNLVHRLVGIPFALFTTQSIDLGISLWMGVINENPRLESRIMAEVAENWEHTVRKGMGIFDPRLRHRDPFYAKEEFAPSNRETLLRRQRFALKLAEPHTRLLQFLNSHFNATRFGSRHSQRVVQHLIEITVTQLKRPVGHPLTRQVHFQFILFSLGVLRYSDRVEPSTYWRLKDQILSAALGWFSHPPRWSFGGNRLQLKAETQLLADIETSLQNLSLVSPEPPRSLKMLQEKQDLLLQLLKHEQGRLMVWLYPLEHLRKHHLLPSSGEKSSLNTGLLPTYLRTAWTESPALAIQLLTRFPSTSLSSSVRWLLLNFPEKAISEPDALHILLGSSLPTDLTFQLKYLLYWAPVDPITAVNYFLPEYRSHPFVLQYAMRALETHPIDVTFFYVPQIVQTLRYDVLGYVERYIIETAKFSQLFAHQIIWNMKANAYKDEDSQVPDSVKPILDAVMESLIMSFSGADRAFYEREFSFFAEITSISGKLRPYIKRSKPEKKQKIEEELRKIKVEVGVYLPSNPDGVVIGIDRKSGKPLQSHAKAPYMATFRIKKNQGELEGVEQMLEQVNHEGSLRQENTVELWQSAIFKVGDDCRQDMLALQLIAGFRGIFHDVGLDVYVYPYRVTATAPGCGVIDVLPNTISRDMLGREAVNGLYDYFVSKYGGEKSVRFQEARSNFVKSMAAYSVISYLLQFKDRHNGNIMIDEAGHILHIDFGFCFDIAPGGVRFERAPFKLTSEMVAVMGGSTESQAYRWFEELCIKSFLAARPHAEKLLRIVRPMLDSGLPCFKPETMQHFRERFVPDKTDREAADFMRDLIKKSYGSYSTKGYDHFQLMTNGIPY